MDLCGKLQNKCAVSVDIINGKAQLQTCSRCAFHPLEFCKTNHELVKKFPPEEKYRLTDQLLRSSRSITAQIAEGHGRFHYLRFS